MQSHTVQQIDKLLSLICLLLVAFITNYPGHYFYNDEGEFESDKNELPLRFKITSLFCYKGRNGIIAREYNILKKSLTTVSD